MAKTTNNLKDKKDWRSLINGSVDAIHLKNFAKKKECDQLVRFITSHEFTDYESASGIRKLGSSFNDVRKSKKLLEEYSKTDILEQALHVNSVLSELLKTIESSWPHGIEGYSYRGFNLHRSIVRRITAGKSAEIHDDNIAKELPLDPIASSVQIQLGVNLYLEMPPKGGELEGWHIRLNSEEYEIMRNTKKDIAYGIKRKEVGKPDG